RGDIVDRHGTTLASSVQRYDLWVNQMQVDQYLQNSRSAEETGVPAAAAELAPVLGWSVSDTEEALTGDRGFVYLLKNVEPAVRDAALALEIPGIGADPVADRIYPAGSVGGNILGFVGDDGAALAGTELSFDDTLRGTDGKTQQIVAGAVEDVGGSGGSAVARNARTGEVLALADYPSYDPNDFGAVDDEDRGNRSISKVFEPGSTGKLFTIAAALEEGTAQ